MNRKTLLALALSAAAVLGGTTVPASAAPTPTTAEAEAWYYTHPGPSLAWQHATWSERGHALGSYLADWEGGTEGCFADLQHAYQGTTGSTTWVQPGLPVGTAPGSDLLLGEYLDGVCGD